MAVRREVARLATVGGLLAGLLVAGATPAWADEDSVRVRATGSFQAGGKPGAVSVEVHKRSKGCVRVRTALAVQLPGVTASQVYIEVAIGNQWRQVSIADSGDGLLTTDAVAPAQQVLCEDKRVTVRYRLTFLSGTPEGRVYLVGEAKNGSGGLIAREVASARVRADRNAVPVTTPPSTAAPTPTEAPTEGPIEPEGTTPVPAAAMDRSEEGGSFGIGTLVMLLGVVMVGIGAALIALLLRRSRQEGGGTTAAPPGVGAAPASWTGASGPPPPAAAPASWPHPAGPVQSRPAGGTTYRSTGNQGGARPPAGTSDGGDATSVMPRLPG